MKKIFLILFGIILILAISTPVMAVGTATASAEYILIGEQKIVLTISWTDDANGTTLAIDAATYGIKGWYLVQAETNPGTAPTDLYDITLISTSGLDVSLGTLMDRSSTLTERVSIASTTVVYPIIIENFTFTLSGNSNVGATGTLKLIFAVN